MASEPKIIERKDYRQELLQYQTYTRGSDETPQYIYHSSREDRLMILCSQIKIWQAKGTDWFDIPSVDADNVLVIREVNSIEISNSYKDVIGTAVIKIPRGTVIEKRYKNKAVDLGDDETAFESKGQGGDVRDSTEMGDVISVNNSRYTEDGVSVASLAPNYDDKGLIEFNRTEKEPALLEPSDMAIGNRIEIRLGYAYSEEEFELIKNGEGKDLNLSLVFTGFITGISVGTPLEIECENMAIWYALQLISPTNISESKRWAYEDSMGWLVAASRFKINPQLPRKREHCGGSPKVDWALATFQRSYNPNENPWLI